MDEKRNFEKVYKELFLPLGMYALRMVEDVDCAEEIVQRCFVAAWEHISTGTKIECLKAYMYRAVRNASINASKPQFEHTKIDELADVSEEDIDTSERDAALWRAVDALPPRCREVLLLSKRDGMSNAEIASQLGISVKTVENQMTKALAALRKEAGLHHWALTNVFFLPFL